MTNFEKITKTKNTLARFLSNIAIKHDCTNCPEHVLCRGAKNCDPQWKRWLGDIGIRLGRTNFKALTTCPEELADFIIYELAIDGECSICPASPCEQDATCWHNLTNWLNKEVEE